ncbi:hypothetical protein FACS189485_08780 [Spirochaetia bacterium]|nr:hypothetical protein FACS189485_08780 [Spirochaetia bacterium]
MGYTETGKGFVFLMTAAFISLWPLQAQESDQRSPDPDARIQLAISSPSYPVTAGDVYSLTYMAGSTPVSYMIVVDNSYRIRVSNMGFLNAAGKTYLQLKQDVEAMVSNNYPLSGVQMLMQNPSSFSVYIKGEVKRAEERTTWAMARLSSLFNSSTLSEYSSIRKVTVTPAAGAAKTYDLFRAERFGDLREDPYLRPGDVITVNHLDRKVSVFGEVERPDTYELLPGENIQELIRNYANGYTVKADTGRVKLTRSVDDDQGTMETIYLTPEEIKANYPLRHFDAIYIPPK